MKRKMLFSLVAVVMMLVPSVKLHAEGNLDDADTSIVSPRFDATGKIAVDAGLMYLLNKYTHVPGTDAAAIDTLKRKLDRASRDFNVLKREAKVAHDALVDRGRNANWGEVNEMAKKRTALSSQISKLAKDRADMIKFSADMRADRAVAARAAQKLASIERQISALRAQDLALAEGLGDILSPDARRTVEELVAARDRAAKLVGDLSDDVTHAQRVGAGTKVIRVVGNVALGLDIAGQGWAFYDNSSTPLAFGGLSKLSQEANDLMFAKVKERATPPAPRVPMTEAQIEKLPTRGTLVPSGNVPGNEATHADGKRRNRRPPLLDKAPDLNAPIAPLDRPRLP